MIGLIILTAEALALSQAMVKTAGMMFLGSKALELESLKKANRLGRNPLLEERRLAKLTSKIEDPAKKQLATHMIKKMRAEDEQPLPFILEKQFIPEGMKLPERWAITENEALNLLCALKNKKLIAEGKRPTAETFQPGSFDIDELVVLSEMRMEDPRTRAELEPNWATSSA